MRQIGRILGGRQAGGRTGHTLRLPPPCLPPCLPLNPSLFSYVRFAVAPQMKNYSLKTREEADSREGERPGPPPSSDGGSLPEKKA